MDLVLVRFDDSVSALYGRCLHRGALLSDGHVDGQNLICGLHGWDYRVDTGVSEYNNEEALARFPSRVDAATDQVMVDAAAVAAWAEKHPQPYDRDSYLGLYQDVHGTPDEPYNPHIQRLAREGLSRVGHHGPVSAMGVALTELPRWDDLQVVTAQLARSPLLDHEEVATGVTIGPRAARPLHLDIPLFVSDMSFGAISEQAANACYFYEYATGRFGWALEKAARSQAFHFKAGQGAKTGTGGHLPGAKVTQRIAEIRGLEPGQDAISPARFEALRTPGDFRAFAQEVRDASGGIPMALGADAVAVSNAALQAIGCLGMRACHSNNCPVGIATMKKDLRARLIVEESARRLTRWFTATTELMKVVARACGHASLSDFSVGDLTTWKRDVAELTGVPYAGVGVGR